MSSGVVQARDTNAIVEDLIDRRTAEVIANDCQFQSSAIPDLDLDWSTAVNEDGDQVRTGATHWPLSRALNS